MSEKLAIKENLAYYLPQFHQIDENDKWWGKGFTEWTQVRSAMKLFKNHQILQPYQGDYYNLMNPEIIGEQYKLAKEHAITGFCFWHYWFGNGEMLLEKPAEILIKSNVEARFCFGWANHSWWNKTENLLLKEQRYLGKEDQRKHFMYLLDFFKDDRYVKIDGKPVFLIFKIYEIPDALEWVRNFRALCKEFGFPDAYIIGEFCKSQDLNDYNLDAVVNSRGMFTNRSFYEKVRDKLIRHKFISESLFNPRVYSYPKLSPGFNSDETKSDKVLPVIIPRWDSTIRHGKNGWLLNGSTPESFEFHVRAVKKILSAKDYNNRVVIIKSWNEWAEGNFIEPDDNYNDAYLKVIKKHFKTTL
ncbi:glycoside hydrolase family 99-like domain-containing protein [Erwinia sp. MYb375]|uniref:glycosyltransferase WbsX family protein n=1 Tax=unclassified Erwinia TaxID=2622719 RepID=UPI0030A25094